MPSAEEIARAVWEQPVDVGKDDGTTQTEKAGLWTGWGNIHALTASQRAEQILTKVDALTARLDSITSVVETTQPAPTIDPDALATVQTAGQQIADAALEPARQLAALATASALALRLVWVAAEVLAALVLVPMGAAAPGKVPAAEAIQEAVPISEAP